MPTDLPPDYKPAPPPKPGEGQAPGAGPAPPGETIKGDPTGSGPKLPGQTEGDIGDLPEPGKNPGNDLPGMPAPAAKPAFRGTWDPPRNSMV